MSPELPKVSNEVIMEAIRIKGEIKLADPSTITLDDIAANDALVGTDFEGIIREQVVRIAMAFNFPNITIPE